jgi:hypothetical protein
LELRRVRVRSEFIRRMKEYGAMHHIWRQQCWMFPVVSELCVFLRREISWHLAFQCFMTFSTLRPFVSVHDWYSLLAACFSLVLNNDIL